MRLHNRGAGLRRRLEVLKPGVIGGLLALLMLVAAACDDKAQPAGPTATGESPGTGAQTQQIPSTPPSSEEGTPPVSRAFVNACTYRAPAPTPTPDLTTPTATPFSNTTPIPYRTESPSAEVVAYTDLPPPALPASVEAWRDAVVRVSVVQASGRTRDQQGLVVADGAVLTVLDHRWEIVSLSVEVSGRGEFTAELERFDPRTGGALLTIEAEDLTVAPGERGRVAPGEPVLLLVRDEDGGELVVKETYASPSLNAPDHLFALHSDYTPSYQRGTIVVAGDGTPIGLASRAGRFYGQSAVWGGLTLRYLPAVLLDSAIHLLERPHSDLGITPAAVAYYRPDRTKAPDGPVTRELLAKPVQKALKDLGEPVPLESLGKRPGSPRPPKLGTILELLYATPQELRGANGELLGSARYIAIWWDREGGAPDLVLCGTDDGNHLGAAFAINGLRSFEALMEGVPSSSPHSMVAAESLRPSGYSSDDYQYPYEWELKTDKPAYSQDELAMLTRTLTNTSDWPVTLNFVPPTVTIFSIQEARDVAVLRYGDGNRVLQPGETASFTMTWDQVHFEGGRATPGHYVAHVHLANLANNWNLSPGPTAYELILE